MAKILDMPKLSPTMEEGVLSAWHKKEGDAIAVDDLLAEVETDKATMEFRAFDAGTLLKLLVPAGSTVRLGQPVAIVGKPGEDVSALLAQAAAAAGAAPATIAAPPPPASIEPTLVHGTAEAAPAMTPAPAAVPAPPVDKGSPLDRTSRAPEPPAPKKGDGGRVFASPYVRKVARELGVELGGAVGTGPGGRVVAADVQALAQGAGSKALVKTGPQTLASSGPSLAPPDARPLSQMRKAIARRLVESKQTVPHFYLNIDVDAGPLVAFRERVNEELAASAPKGEAPPKISVNDLLVKACALALRRVPECNAQFTPDAILVHQRIDVSVAVAVPDGLVTPVVRDADKKSVVTIAAEIRELASRARAKKLKPEEMTDGTFSISNLGMYGIDEFAAVINPPEGAILAVGRVRDEAVVQGGAVVPGKRLAMTLSCDHRVVDGAVGAAFLAELRALLERPMRILTG
jgi:pyruvate dehydrogenase E2 component (dihydrolipoamide acetyltransferase)